MASEIDALRSQVVDLPPTKEAPPAPAKEAGSEAEAAAGDTAPGEQAPPLAEERPLAEPAAVPARDESSGTVVPVPGSLRHEAPRGGFWRRIALRTRGGLASASVEDRVLARLDVLDARLTAAEQSLANRIERLDQRFTQVWEVEEQLSQLMEIQELLTEMRDREDRTFEALRRMSRRNTLLAALAAAAFVALAALVLVAG